MNPFERPEPPPPPMPTDEDVEIVANLRAMSADPSRLFEVAAYGLANAEAIERVRLATEHAKKAK